ncbi:ThiF family adenylyltransferase [Bradyrhizobium japonicum]|uniref:ThiF family adenylyltransferase n=1 Tax=Bradyrhizobium japonicum TaxID=375 RepID=UPI0005765B23|nr:ThiF family adenylyltransferase [Bradyrhizobium japonicum]
MSIIPIDRSPDLQRLRTEGYNVQVTSAGYLVVRDVPYVNSKREIAIGALASNLDLAGDITAQPQDHTAKFIGEYPCDSQGSTLTVLQHTSGSFDLGSGLIAQHSFSRKPACGRYENYHEKMTAYIALLGKHVAAIDPLITAKTHRVIEPEDDNSPFNYLDTASSRAEINTITARLVEDAIAIVGLGGTGSYVLDMVAKTPVQKIHIIDADRFLTHNAFRAPGAPAIEKLREQPLKVEYFASTYAHMHRGIVPHPFHIDATNLDELNGMSFVFLCMEGGTAKRAIVDKLDALGIPFADVGMGLYAKRNSIGGMLRNVLSLPDARESARARISFATDDANNEYDKNIQVADLNALNACLAVIAWKKLRGFYFNLGKERFVSYTIANSLLAKGDTL